MRHVIYALGAVLVLCGLTGLYWSIDLAGIERGTAFASSGASLLGAGVVTIALGRVTQLLERLAAAGPIATAFPPRVSAPAAPEPAAVEPPAPALGVGGVALAAAQAEAALAQSEGGKPPRAAESAAPDAEPADAAAAPRRTTSVAPPATTAREESGPGGIEPFAIPPPAPAPPAPAKSGAAPAPKPEVRIVGRYQANGVDYALFSDGSIEAERGGVKQRFSSLSDLKHFIEEG